MRGLVHDRRRLTGARYRSTIGAVTACMQVGMFESESTFKRPKYARRPGDHAVAQTVRAGKAYSAGKHKASLTAPHAVLER
jgi:hypothetical protein